ncbi:MAG: hypothetical protein AB7O32_11520 [Vicinamibacterales bacterium]
MYTAVLALHSWLRWGALIAGVLAVASLASSKSSDARSVDGDRWSLFFMIALDLQLLIGLLLYLFISPNTTAMFRDFGAAMRDPVARFWAVEHVTLMFVAIVAAHVGRVLGRKAASPAAGRSKMLVAFIIALVAIMAATPWPGMRAGRPLFRISAP